MRKVLPGILLFVCCFTVGVTVEPRLAYTQAYARHEKSPVQVILGDARRFFAGYFFTKADVYFHSGFYPSIFDQTANGTKDESHLANSAGGHEGENTQFLGKPRDWIDKFSRSFYPSTHTHLDAGGARQTCNEDHSADEHAGHNHDDDHAGHEDHDEPVEDGGGEIREILPWLSIAAELDPNRVETYTVGSYWLRTRLNKPKEAEEFLRKGLRENPGHYAILFELGRIYHEVDQDNDRARNIWEYALKKWNEQEGSKADPDTFILSQLTWHLALVEQESGNRPKAISYLQLAKRVSPHPEEVEKRIEEIRAGL